MGSTRGRWGAAWLAAAVAVLSLAGCGNGPDIEADFAKKLPADWQLEAFDLLAREDAGSKVEPKIRFRFKAEVAPKSDLYSEAGVLDGTRVLKTVYEKGQERELIGTGTSDLHGEQWSTHFSYEQDGPGYGLGRPAQAFQEPRVVMGSSDYRRLVARVKSSHDELERQILSGQQRWQQMLKTFGELDQARQERERTSAQSHAAERQRVQQRRQELQIQASRQNQALAREQQADIDGRTQAPRRELDARLAELDNTYRLQSAEIQARRTRLQQTHAAQRKQLRDAYNADLAAARKRLDRAGFATYRAQADERLREDSAALDARLGNEQAPLREQESALGAERRQAAEQAQAAYRQQAEAIRQAVQDERGGAREAATQRHAEAAAALDAELAQLQQRHQAELAEARQAVAAQRAEMEALQRQLRADGERLRREHQLIEQLEVAKS